MQIDRNALLSGNRAAGLTICISVRFYIADLFSWDMHVIWAVYRGNRILGLTRISSGGFNVGGTIYLLASGPFNFV